MSLLDVIQGLADVLAEFYPDVNVTAWEPATPVTPAIFPLIPDGSYHPQFAQGLDGGSADVTLVVRVLVAGGNQEFASENLIPYLDPTGERSVRAAVEADPTFGGACDFATVTGWTNGGSRFEYAGITGGAIGVDFNVSVLL